MAPTPIFIQIEIHKALRDRANTMMEQEDSPAYLATCKAEEDAIQTLADFVPKSLVEAAALLKHMADTEGEFFDSGSPLVRAVYSVANTLTAMAG